MSRKAKTLSLSKSFIEGISPVVVSCVDGVLRRDVTVPLMILQKMQAAAMIDDV
jgi:hypothetical protein